MARLVGHGQFDEALAQYQTVLKIDPNDVQALNNIAWLRATHPDPKFRDGVQAMILARRAVELTPDNPEILDTLAAAYAEAGRFPEAVETARKALDLAARQKKLELVDALKTELLLYKSGTPFRETLSSPGRTPSQP